MFLEILVCWEFDFQYNKYYIICFVVIFMGRKSLRQLRWEVGSEDNPEQHEYVLLLINQRREIHGVIQRASEHLAPADAPLVIGDGVVARTGLRYSLVKIVAYQTPPTQIIWKNIYSGKVVRDRNLGPRARTDNLVEYVENSLREDKFS
jgi:hypothetical protein